MGEQMMSCPMMNMMSVTTQPVQDTPATSQNREAHH
jgi:hypothetical protein